MINSYDEFEHLAVPHSWFLVANELHEMALVLYKEKGKSYLTEISYVDDGTKKIDLANRSAFLLGGFALENAIKAFLVYENPSWIADGKLSKKLKGHDLTKLAKNSKLLPWPKKGLKVLRAFESGLTSWARYPCPLSISQKKPERYFKNDLWEQYEKQMERYFRELKTLLNKLWRGPHSFVGRYSISSDF